jgi:hypothetical protein
MKKPLNAVGVANENRGKIMFAMRLRVGDIIALLL